MVCVHQLAIGILRTPELSELRYQLTEWGGGWILLRKQEKEMFPETPYIHRPLYKIFFLKGPSCKINVSVYYHAGNIWLHHP